MPENRAEVAQPLNNERIKTKNRCWGSYRAHARKERLNIYRRGFRPPTPQPAQKRRARYRRKLVTGQPRRNCSLESSGLHRMSRERHCPAAAKLWPSLAKPSGHEALPSEWRLPSRSAHPTHQALTECPMLHIDVASTMALQHPNQTLTPKPAEVPTVARTASVKTFEALPAPSRYTREKEHREALPPP